MSDSQSNIPTKLFAMPGADGSEQDRMLTDPQVGAMLAAGSTPQISASQSPSASREELQGIFPEYQIRDILGRGGMSTVYRACDETLGREVAFKVLRTGLMTEELALEKFVNEARITAQLDHPNIPAVYALEPDREGLSVFTMKLLEGQTLESLADENERDGRDGIPAAIEILLRICDAVAFAHSKGVLHLDLKPSNVIVAAFGQIYLVDWGIAHRKAELPNGPGGMRSVEGTPSYMAPEQARGEQWKLDERTDIFALGGLFYHILCGRAPHTAPTTEQMLTLAANAGVTPPDMVAAEKGRTLPRRLVSICMKAMAADPENRYQRVQEFQQDLEQFARGVAQWPQRTFKAGEAIITEGGPGDAAYVIISGNCVATRLVNGQPQGLRVLKPGDMFGEAAVFTGKPRSATVCAVTDTVVGVVEKAALREEMERTTFMSLAIRTVTSTFLDLDRQLARQRERSQVVDLALRHVALHGERGRMPWKPLLATLTQRTGASEADVAAWLLGTEGVSIEGELLVLLS
ncbi:MAG: cyclic nucleotide-binding domain-containing protein [Chthoniobacteraceae bacterium]